MVSRLASHGLRWSGVVTGGRRRRAAAVDVPLPRQELDGHGGHQARAFTRGARALPLDPASALHIGSAAGDCNVPHRDQLVSPGIRHRGVLSACRPNEDGRGQSRDSFRRQLSGLHGTDRQVPAPNGKALNAEASPRRFGGILHVHEHPPPVSDSRAAWRACRRRGLRTLRRRRPPARRSRHRRHRARRRRSAPAPAPAPR